MLHGPNIAICAPRNMRYHSRTLASQSRIMSNRYLKAVAQRIRMSGTGRYITTLAGLQKLEDGAQKGGNGCVCHVGIFCDCVIVCRPFMPL